MISCNINVIRPQLADYLSIIKSINRTLCKAIPSELTMEKQNQTLPKKVLRTAEVRHDIKTVAAELTYI